MKTKKSISIVVFIILCFLFKNTAIAQILSQTDPLFVLQGAVKQNGRPVSGAELILLKDGKQITKIITPKNGLYYFSLIKTNTDSKSEYLLKINKQGSFSGVLRVNTYVPKEQFSSIPYLFNLDITFNSEFVAQKDFGRINWAVEKNVFLFDKNYITVTEKKSISLDSTIAVKDSAVKKTEKSANKVPTNILTNISVAKPEKLKNEEISKNSSDVKKASNTTANNSINPKTVVKAESNSVAKNTTYVSNSQNQMLTQSQRVNIKNKLIESETNNKNSTSPSNLEVTVISKRDSLAANSSIQKDLFFLTGVPMGQFKTSLPSPNQEIKNADVYDPNEIYSINSEKSKTLSEKQRFERKKAENFAKKYETNNRLTSLMNEVDEFDKKNK